MDAKPIRMPTVTPASMCFAKGSGGPSKTSAMPRLPSWRGTEQR